MKFLWLGIHKSFLLLIIFVLFSHGWSLREIGDHDSLVSLQEEKAATGDEGQMMYPYGSSLPDCSHACGACFPCKRVIVSFKCSSAESCPIVYRCMCKGKYYHVPSN
ncbi:protein EPIDERMAL PATTERNING FACTOR 2-like [Neltuma alba]|uniref:protein EPIDERMAL PATTERNING FACTOR 2-like n=1 Tax=Neltuma alba TaxID=207710 RepID=UPI0010A44085|nr:protein EPIDERMAL PATTERNING FACTOR 2-like [Prosopis alba]XP_028795940.1 protein EPIDERMAL PATTERNING FACTOR 2-like [Prosopis alba]